MLTIYRVKWAGDYLTKMDALKLTLRYFRSLFGCLIASPPKNKAINGAEPKKPKSFSCILNV
jgi:hypothetical protein